MTNAAPSDQAKRPGSITTSTGAAGVALFALGFLCGWLLLGDTNRALTYGPTGAPKNCRALIILFGIARNQPAVIDGAFAQDRTCCAYRGKDSACVPCRPTRESR